MTSESQAYLEHRIVFFKQMMVHVISMIHLGLLSVNFYSLRDALYKHITVKAYI